MPTWSRKEICGTSCYVESTNNWVYIKIIYFYCWKTKKTTLKMFVLFILFTMEHSYIFVLWTMDELILNFLSICRKFLLNKIEFQMAAGKTRKPTKNTHKLSLRVCVLFICFVFFHYFFLVLIITIISPSSLKLRHIWIVLKVVFFVFMRFAAHCIKIIICNKFNIV